MQRDAHLEGKLLPKHLAEIDLLVERRLAELREK